MIEKDFIPYEIALGLKQLGFNEPCLGSYYHTGKKLDIPAGFKYIDHGEYTVLAPSYSQAFRWFRKECALESYIRANLFVDVPKTYQFYIDENIDDIWYDTYEEAELECLKGLIKTVKGGNK
jgi:hypothetical protein